LQRSSEPDPWRAFRHQRDWPGTVPCPQPQPARPERAALPASARWARVSVGGPPPGRNLRHACVAAWNCDEFGSAPPIVTPAMLMLPAGAEAAEPTEAWNRAKSCSWQGARARLRRPGAGGRGGRVGRGRRPQARHRGRLRAAATGGHEQRDGCDDEPANEQYSAESPLLTHSIREVDDAKTALKML
jgi:hypothetical protein